MSARNTLFSQLQWRAAARKIIDSEWMYTSCSCTTMVVYIHRELSDYKMNELQVPWQTFAKTQRAIEVLWCLRGYTIVTSQVFYWFGVVIAYSFCRRPFYRRWMDMNKNNSFPLFLFSQKFNKQTTNERAPFRQWVSKVYNSIQNR